MVPQTELTARLAPDGLRIRDEANERTFPNTVIPDLPMAEATSPATSDTLLGMMSVLLVLARLPKAEMYSSATFKLAADMPPSLPMASATIWIPAVVASATSRIAVASPAPC